MPNEFKVKNGLIVDAGGTTITGSFTASGSSHTIIGTLNATSSQAVSASFALTASYVTASSIIGTVTSASYALTASYALNAGSGGTISTASLLTTASATSNVITFTKGDASTFTVTVATGSGGTAFPYTGSANITGSLNVVGPLTITASTYAASVRFAGLDATNQAFDLVYPTNGALRFGVSGGDGPQFQGWGGTEPNFPGQMYFDYGSFTRNVANRAAYWRSMTTGATTTVMTLDASGNLGLGKTPTAKLDVTGSVSITGSTSIQDPTSQSPFQISSGSTSLLFVSSSGNIGLNRTAPNAKLHIADSGSFGGTVSGSFLGLHLETLTTASSGLYQNTPGIRLTGYSFQSPSSSINQWDIYGVGTSGASYSHTLVMRSNTAGSSIVPFQLTQNGSLTISNVMSAYSYSTTSGVLNLGSNNVAVYSITNRAASSTGRSLYLRTNLGTVADDGVYVQNATNLNIATGTQTGVTVNDTIAYASGTGSYNAISVPTTLSSSAAASGSIVRGLYINPSISSSVGDYRAIETTAGRVILASSAFTGSTAIQSYFTVTGSMQQVQTASVQLYGVNISPTMVFTTGSQTQTALRVAPTFTGSSAFTSSQQNIIADFGATSVGTQFSVNDVTSGSIYMVNDVSGLPIIEALSDWTVNMYNYPTRIFQKTGSSIIISGSQTIVGNSTIQSPLQVSSGSTSLLYVSSSGNIGLGTSTPGVNLHTFSTTANTSTVAENTRLQLSSTGTTAAGFGQRLGFYGKASTLDGQLYASIDGTFRFISSTTSWGGRLNFNIVNNGVTVTPLQVDGNGPGAVNVVGNLSVSSGVTTTTNVYATTQGVFMNASTAQTYRTTNAGGVITPLLAAGSRTNDGAGAPALYLDATNQLVFAAMNNAGTPLAIARASIQVTGSNNTAGSEAGDLIFLTQTGGTAMTEKMRITGAGAVNITGSLNISGSSTITGSLTFNGSALDTAWTSYTPSWTTTGTQPTLGDGTLTGAYKQIGKTVFVRVRLVFGTTTTGGTGDWKFNLPVTASSAAGIQFPCSILDSGNAWYQATVNGQYGGETFRTSIIGQSAGANSSQGVTATFPITWGNLDSLQFNGSYESI